MPSLRQAMPLALIACAAGCAPEDEPAEPPIAEAEQTIAATDFSTLDLGAPVRGAAGDAIHASLVAGDVALADLAIRVHCPGSIDEECIPAELPGTTIYTYVYEVRPGFDGPNSAGFPNPERVVPVERGESFALAFPASGFTGVAGYMVDEAIVALEPGFNTVISCHGGRLAWTVSDEARWSTGETITFFWQSTQPPGEQTGEYVFIADGAEARARGAMPRGGGGELPAVCG